MTVCGGSRKRSPFFVGRFGPLRIYCPDMEKYKTAFVAYMDRTEDTAPLIVNEGCENINKKAALSA